MSRKAWKVIKDTEGETKVSIYGNNHKIPLLTWYDLTEKEKKEKDWLDTEDKQLDASFFRYKGWLYCMDEVERIYNSCDWMKEFDGQHGDSFFSGILVKYYRDEYGHLDPDYILTYTYIS